jgi:hypothetical protein
LGAIKQITLGFVGIGLVEPITYIKTTIFYADFFAVPSVNSSIFGSWMIDFVVFGSFNYFNSVGWACSGINSQTWSQIIRKSKINLNINCVGFV